MQYRPLDADGDYTLGQKFLDDVPAAVAQAVQTRLLLWAGEWFLDNTEGTPWGAQVLGPRANTNPDAVIKQRILGTPGVLSITSYSSSFDGSNRAFTVNVVVQTQFGPATISQVVTP